MTESSEKQDKTSFLMHNKMIFFGEVPTFLEKTIYGMVAKNRKIWNVCMQAPA
jgi:hypothetical protein